MTLPSFLARVPSRRPALPPVAVMALILACLLPEMVLQGADLGLWGSARWRPLTYQNGAFWLGLLYGWTPNYALQPFAMFVTHAFLHAGLLHLIVNMMTLLSLGTPIVARIGQGRFLVLYALAVLGGGAGFALLATSPRPMVGASGALFGLVGAWIVWGLGDAWRESRGTGIGTHLRILGTSLLWPVAWLILLNLVMLWGTGGLIAWETHLGGFVAGAMAAPLLDRRPASPGAAEGGR